MMQNFYGRRSKRGKKKNNNNNNTSLREKNFKNWKLRPRMWPENCMFAEYIASVI